MNRQLLLVNAHRPTPQSASEAATHEGQPAGWPDVPGVATAYVQLAAQPRTPYWARRHAHAVLSAWQLHPATIETAILLVSELVTNAVAATITPAPGPPAASAVPITQTLRLQPGRIVIEVTDPDPSPPLPEHAGPDAETGRGLMLVDALSKEWSYYYPPSSGGKTVYCVIALEP